MTLAACRLSDQSIRRSIHTLQENRSRGNCNIRKESTKCSVVCRLLVCQVVMLVKMVEAVYML